MENFSERLKQLREEHQLSVKQLCEKLDIPETTYREWEIGRQIKGHAAYIKIASLYKMPIHELLTGEKVHQVELKLQIEKIEAELQQLKKLMNSLN